MADRTMFRGDTLVFDVQVFQAPQFGAPPGTPTPPQNITGWFMWFTAKFHASDADSQAVSQVTSAPLGGIVFVDALSGRAEITMPAIATRSFPDGPVALIYDVQTKDLLGRISTVDAGTLTVNPDATRAIA